MLAHEAHPNDRNWIDQLNNQTFSWARFEFTMQTQMPSFLPPYKGSTIRGGFGHSFRKTCCTMYKMECINCMLNQNCAYSYIFETPKAAENKLDYQAEKLPHPFVIEPPASRQTEFQPGDEFTIGLVLFGKAISFLPYFVFTIYQMGIMGLGKGRGKFELTAGFTNDAVTGPSNQQIYDNRTQKFFDNFKEWQFSDLLPEAKKYDKQTITIELLTPSRLLSKNRLVSDIQFDLFIRSLLRRISLLASIHCNSEWNLPYQDIIAAAQERVQLIKQQIKWYDWERYSNRQKTRMNMGGVVGTLLYEGDLEPFLPLLLLGQFTHIGKIPLSD
jgi:hypothetical protein